MWSVYQRTYWMCALLNFYPKGLVSRSSSLTGINHFLLCIKKIIAQLRLWLTRYFNRSRIVLVNQSSGDKLGPTKANSNVDLFAAGERKVVKPLVNVVPISVATKTVTETKKVVDVVEPARDVEKVISSSVVDSAISAASSISSTPAPSSSRNSMIELQAELLRLEAEKEQLEMDQLRLDEEKVSNQNDEWRCPDSW